MPPSQLRVESTALKLTANFGAKRIEWLLFCAAYITNNGNGKLFWLAGSAGKKKNLVHKQLGSTNFYWMV